MTDDDKNIVLDWAIGMLLVGLVVGYLIGCDRGAAGQITTDRDAACKVGIGEYYLDDKHERQFRWTPPKPQPEKAAP